MDKLNLYLFLFISIFKQYACVLEEFCDKDDFECQRQNDVTKLGTLQHGKSQEHNILRRVQRVGMHECVTECLVTSQCIAINYRKDWKLCDLLGEIPRGKKLRDESGSTFSKISTWPKSLAGRCADHTCDVGNKCEKQQNGGLSCLPAYCEESAPDIKNAACIEHFGMYKNLGTANLFQCNSDFTMRGNPFLVCKDNGEWKSLFCCLPNNKVPHDCSDIPSDCTSGIYRISPKGTSEFDVFCDMETAGGGWTVFQRRLDNSTNFYRGWSTYQNGFGNLQREFWLGNTYINEISSSGKYKLYIELEDFDGIKKYAEYNLFSVGDAASNYILRVSGYNGSSTADDSFSYHNGMEFSTFDNDNDRWKGTNCAILRDGAWWYNICIKSNLNGLYLGGKTDIFGDGIVWTSWHGKKYSLKSTKMMITRN
ncbi:fibrinogen-like protein 1 [Mytilus edulis]|uniref:fibrinogen-like protein 1 n=1 Tax=Mytilus edulis TaxID=6550 RepID=UPI0039F00A77